MGGPGILPCAASWRWHHPQREGALEDDPWAAEDGESSLGHTEAEGLGDIQVEKPRCQLDMGPAAQRLGQRYKFGNQPWWDGN